MVCAVGDEGLGIVGFDESGGSVLYLRIGILVVWVLKFGIVRLKDVGRCFICGGFCNLGLRSYHCGWEVYRT